MDRYILFRHLADLVNDYAGITDARLKNYNGDISIVGEGENFVVRVTAEITMKEGDEHGA